MPLKTNAVIACVVFFAFIAAKNASAQFFGGGTGQTSFSTAGGDGSGRVYPPHGSVGTAYVESDFDSRSVVVIADEETSQYIREIINHLDRPVAQVLIKVVFVEVTHRTDVDFGTEFSIQHEDDDGGTFDTAFGLEAVSFGGFYRIIEEDFQATIQAIEEVGRTEILSRPSILTRNNQEAVITVGQEVPFPTNTTVSDSGQVTSGVEFRDIGIILRVTPFITEEGLVEMIIAPEISALTGETVPITENLDAPVFSKRSADTVVTTPDGQTVVIGGMMEDNVTETERKIPILGDIPLLGKLFSRTTKDNTKTELLIFLTPIVVKAPKMLPDLSRYESSRTKLVPETFGKNQMDNYLDNLSGNQPLDYRSLAPQTPFGSNTQTSAAPQKTVAPKTESLKDRLEAVEENAEEVDTATQTNRGADAVPRVNPSNNR